MDLFSTTSSDLNQIENIQFDLFICASGYERRSIHVAQKFSINARRKIALGFKNHTNQKQRIENDSFFGKNRFELIITDDDSTLNIYEIITASIRGAGESVNVLVDYSSMTRVWYSAIISFMNYLDVSKEINLYFIYSFGLFEKPLEKPVRNIHVGPIENFTSISLPDKPTALIIGLGYERDRAFGLTEYLDAETYVFYNDLSKGADYNKEVLDVNSELLTLVKDTNIFEYPIGNLDYTESLLYSVCKSLSSDYRIILAPTGPKPFTLVCLLVSLRLKNIDVWRISAGKDADPYNREADGTVSFYKVCFQPARVDTSFLYQIN